MKSSFQTDLPPGLVESLVAEVEAEEDAIERLIAAHAAGEHPAMEAALEHLISLRGARTAVPSDHQLQD